MKDLYPLPHITSTLLGLLGTSKGLIEAFKAVANAHPAEKANFLSACISMAQNTYEDAFEVGSVMPL